MPHAVEQVEVVRSHASPARQSLAFVHPQTPPTQAVPFPLPVQSRQPVPHARELVSALHVPPRQHVPAPHDPSPAWPQAALQVPPAPQVGVPPAQTLHAAPPMPHAPADPPATHCDPLQQPPLQAVSLAPPQVALQVCVAVLHAVSLGQSVAVLQPHWSVDAMHADPLAFPAQGMHEPEPPQAVGLVPGRQVPPDPQQPDRHGALGTAQVKLQSLVAVSQPALAGGQSVETVHPHCPPPATGSHTLPPVSAANPAGQEAHSPPLFPQVAGSVPAWQLPAVAAEQQPPLQGCAVSQLVVQAFVATSQA